MSTGGNWRSRGPEAADDLEEVVALAAEEATEHRAERQASVRVLQRLSNARVESDRHNEVVPLDGHGRARSPVTAERSGLEAIPALGSTTT